LTALALALSACGGKHYDARPAVETFNAGAGPAMLSDFLQQSGAVSSCRLAPHPVYRGESQLSVVTTHGLWLQATIDPAHGDVSTTEGGSLDPKRAAQMRRGVACRLSQTNGALSLVR
jgi:hypothetical protein